MIEPKLKRVSSLRPGAVIVLSESMIGFIISITRLSHDIFSHPNMRYDMHCFASRNNGEVFDHHEYPTDLTQYKVIAERNRWEDAKKKIRPGPIRPSFQLRKMLIFMMRFLLVWTFRIILM